MKKITSILASGLLAISLAATAAAQDTITPNTGVGADPTPSVDTRPGTSTTTDRFDNDENDDSFNWGWLGLLGLIGLAGLMPRDNRDRDRHLHGHNVGTTTTRTV